VSRNAVCLAVREDGGVGPLTPVIDVLVAQADATANRAAEQRLSVKRKPSIELLFKEFNYDFGRLRTADSRLRLPMRANLRNPAEGTAQ
jgi:hypothetical protein